MLNNVTFLDKLCFGSSVWRVKKLCLVVPASEDVAGTGQEKCTKEASVGIM